MPRELPGIALAAVVSLGLGAVIGPEAPLIALGGGLALLVGQLVARGANAQALAVIGAAGSFAAVSTLLGSPLLGAFLLLEASGLGGAMATVVLVPGLLAAGTGALVFIGMDSLTGFGTFSLSIPNLPVFVRPDVAEFGWALVIGVGAAIVGTAIRRLGFLVRPHIEKHLVLLTPVAGLVVAALAVVYAEWSDHGTSDVLFSGQSALPVLIANSATYSAGALVLLIVCKSLAYSVSLAGFRGGPVFPAMFIGAAGGMALSHLPGLPAGGGRGDGDRRDDGGDAPAPADGGDARHPAAGVGRSDGDAARHRGRRGGVRRVGVVPDAVAGDGGSGRGAGAAGRARRREPPGHGGVTAPATGQVACRAASVSTPSSGRRLFWSST